MVIFYFDIHTPTFFTGLFASLPYPSFNMYKIIYLQTDHVLSYNYFFQ